MIGIKHHWDTILNDFQYILFFNTKYTIRQEYNTILFWGGVGLVQQPYIFWIDHKNLEYICTAKVLNSCQTWWAQFFNLFNFVLSYSLGSKNIKPDALSCQLQSDEFFLTLKACLKTGMSSRGDLHPDPHLSVLLVVHQPMSRSLWLPVLSATITRFSIKPQLGCCGCFPSFIGLVHSYPWALSLVCHCLLVTLLSL